MNRPCYFLSNSLTQPTPFLSGQFFKNVQFLCLKSIKAACFGHFFESPIFMRSPGVRNGNPPQYSCLENSADRRAWRTTVHGGHIRVRHGWATEHALMDKIKFIFCSVSLSSVNFIIRPVNEPRREEGSFPSFCLWLGDHVFHPWVSPVAQTIKNLPVMQELQEMWVRYLDGGRFPGGGHGNLLQYSCLENSMNRGAWHATVHEVPRSQTRLKWLSIPMSSLKSWVVKQVFSFERWLVFPGKDVRAAAPGRVFGEWQGVGVGTAGEAEGEGKSYGSAVISSFCWGAGSAPVERQCSWWHLTTASFWGV